MDSIGRRDGWGLDCLGGIDIRPLAIDLFCGLGGWAEGLLDAGFDVIGFDIEHHDYGHGGYPGQLVLQDVLTLRGSQFKDAQLIVASPPCQAYSYRAMPWKRAKSLPPPDNTLFDACFRIQREASKAAGRHIPMVVENVCGAQKWVGPAKWHYGSYYLWGDVPALMPTVDRRDRKFQCFCSPRRWRDRDVPRLNDGIKLGGNWRHDTTNNVVRRMSFKSDSRKAASAMIARIPYRLARWIGDVYYPRF